MKIFTLTLVQRVCLEKFLEFIMFKTYLLILEIIKHISGIYHCITAPKFSGFKQ